MAKPVGPRHVVCYHCGHDLEVSGRAMSTFCPECNRSLVIEDLTIKQYTAVKVLETCGRLVIPKRGHAVIMGHVVAHGGIRMDGKLSCEQAISRAPVVIGPKAIWQGSLRAPSLVVHAGAVIQEGFFSIPEEPRMP